MNTKALNLMGGGGTINKVDLGRLLSRALFVPFEPLTNNNKLNITPKIAMLAEPTDLEENPDLPDEQIDLNIDWTGPSGTEYHTGKNANPWDGEPIFDLDVSASVEESPLPTEVQTITYLDDQFVIDNSSAALTPSQLFGSWTTTLQRRSITIIVGMDNSKCIDDGEAGMEITATGIFAIASETNDGSFTPLLNISESTSASSELHTYEYPVHFEFVGDSKFAVVIQTPVICNTQIDNIEVCSYFNFYIKISEEINNMTPVANVTVDNVNNTVDIQLVE